MNSGEVRRMGNLGEWVQGEIRDILPLQKDQ